MSQDTGEIIIGIFVLIVYGVGGYIAFHFITKFW